MDWNKLFSTDCEVVRLGNQWIYPIFKCGWYGFNATKEESRTNKQITNTDLITVFLRDPRERFVSGVNKYAQIHNLEPSDVVDKIEQGELTDRHWVPQYYWLMHLSKYYNKDVKLLPMSDIPHNKRNLLKNKKPVRVIEKYTLVDHFIMAAFLNTTTNLKELIKECRNVLS